MTDPITVDSLQWLLESAPAYKPPHWTMTIPERVIIDLAKNYTLEEIGMAIWKGCLGVAPFPSAIQVDCGNGIAYCLWKLEKP